MEELPGESIAVPDLAPYAAEGLVGHVEAFPRDSMARQILDGTYVEDYLVPGSAYLFYAGQSTGTQQAVISRIGAGSSLGIYARCGRNTDIKASLYDSSTGRRIGALSGSCGPDDESGATFGAGRSEAPLYLDVEAGDGVPLDITVFGYEQAE